MLVGMATGLNQEISVQDIGLTGLTHADGLAVGRPSGFVGRVMKNLLGGEFTIRDGKLYDYMTFSEQRTFFLSQVLVLLLKDQYRLKGMNLHANIYRRIILKRK